MDGIYNPKMDQKAKEVYLKKKPVDEFLKELIDKGAKIVCCGISLITRGLDINGSDYPEGVIIGGLEELAEIIEKSDKFISLWFVSGEKKCQKRLVYL